MVARSFAHLVGLGRRPRMAVAEETDEQRRERERREDEDDARHAERDDEMRRMAEDGEDTGESEDERRDREERDARRSRRAREQAAAEDEDDEGDDTSDREEMRGHGVAARARAHERGRIAAILSGPRAAANLPLAVELACNSQMSRSEALGVLSRTPLPARLDRAARNPQIGVGGGAAGGPAGGGRGAPVQDMWSQAFARVVPAMRRPEGRGR
jgi:hypothetical protein